MKKVTLLFILMLSLLICKGQGLLEEGKMWSNTSIGTMPGSSYHSDFVQFMGDSTINGLGYKKILLSEDALHTNWIVLGCIREEVTTGKVFIFNSYKGKDMLLYDFSLETGDSILTDDGVSYAKVTKVIHATFGNSTTIRKQIYFGNTLWVEGIGSTLHVLAGLHSFFTTGSTNSLVCYSEKDQLVYHNSKFNNCFPEGLEGDQHTEFAPIGAEWYYSQYESFNPPMANYIKHSCIKDSTIEGKKVKVIQKTKFRYGGVSDHLGYEYLYQHGDTIFYYKSGEFHELYNFSLLKGDSILLYSEMPNDCSDKTPYGWSGIDSVYYTKMNNYQLKAYNSSHKEGSVWGFDSFPIIEKIGSTRYLLPQNAFCGFVDGDPGIGLLRCYTDPYLGIFHYGNMPCDTVTTYPDGLSMIEKPSFFKIYPNPASEKLSIEGNFNKKEYSLKLYSVMGELLKTECVDGGVNIYRMDVGTLKSGIYILRLVSASGKYSEEVFIKR